MEGLLSQKVLDSESLAGFQRPAMV